MGFDERFFVPFRDVPSNIIWASAANLEVLMAITLATAEFSFGLHKKKKHPKKKKRFVDVGRLAADGISIGDIVSIKSKSTNSEWEGTVTQDNDDKDSGNHARFLTTDIEVITEAKEVKGTEDLTVTITNPTSGDQSPALTVTNVPVIP